MYLYNVYGQAVIAKEFRSNTQYSAILSAQWDLNVIKFLDVLFLNILVASHITGYLLRCKGRLYPLLLTREFLLLIECRDRIIAKFLFNLLSSLSCRFGCTLKSLYITD